MFYSALHHRSRAYYARYLRYPAIYSRHVDVRLAPKRWQWFPKVQHRLYWPRPEDRRSGYNYFSRFSRPGRMHGLAQCRQDRCLHSHSRYHRSHRCSHRNRERNVHLMNDRVTIMIPHKKSCTHSLLRCFRSIYDNAFNKFQSLNGSSGYGVGATEAEHWHRRAYGGPVSLSLSAAYDIQYKIEADACILG